MLDFRYPQKTFYKVRAMETGYEKLDIFKMSYELAIKIHKMTLALPKFEMYEEGSQIRRAAKSIPSNIVEGYCLRKYKKDYILYLHRAFASSQEAILHLKTLYESGSLTDKNIYDDLLEQYDHLGRMIFRFIESVEADHQPPLYVKENDSEYHI